MRLAGTIFCAVLLLALSACGGGQASGSEASVRQQYDQVIAPLLPVVARDCRAAETNTQELLGFQRTVELAGLQGSFSSELSAVIEALQSGIDRCWEEATKPCVDPDNHDQVQRALTIARTAALAGMDQSAHFYPDPDLDCPRGLWVGTITLTDVAQTEVDGGFYSREVRLDVSFQQTGGRWTAQAEESSDTGWQSGCPDYRSQTEMTASAEGNAYLEFTSSEGGPTRRTGEPGSGDDVAARLVLNADGTYRLVLSFGVLEGTTQVLNESRPPCITEYRSNEQEEPFSWSPPFGFVEGRIDPADPRVVSGSRTEGTATMAWELRRE